MWKVAKHGPYGEQSQSYIKYVCRKMSPLPHPCYYNSPFSFPSFLSHTCAYKPSLTPTLSFIFFHINRFRCNVSYCHFSHMKGSIQQIFFCIYFFKTNLWLGNTFTLIFFILFRSQIQIDLCVCVGGWGGDERWSG